MARQTGKADTAKTSGKGRAGSFDRASVMATICEAIASGRSLRSVCADDGMPKPSTVVDWLSEDAALAEQYARARERQADHYAEELIEIVDTEADAARARVRMDARKWVASKLAPKRYGDKVLNELTGADGGAIKINTSEAAAELSKILAGIQQRKGEA